MRAVFAILLAIVALAASSEDVTETLLYDVPVPSQASLKIVTELQSMDPYKPMPSTAKEVEELQDSGATVNLEQSLLVEDHHEETPLDLLDVNFKELVPKVDKPEFKAMRTELAQLRHQLQPMHKKICSSAWSSCIARRRENARIIADVVRNKCHLRRNCKHVNPCGRWGCKAGKRKLRKVTRVYRRTRTHYTQLYIRYAMLLARYYKAKFRTLARIFVLTVAKLRWESRRIVTANRDLRRKLKDMQKKHADFHKRSAAEHNKISTNLKNMKDKAQKHRATAARIIKDVKAELMAERTRVATLNKVLADLKAKLAACGKANAQAKKNRATAEAALAKAKGQHKALLTKLGQTMASIKNAEQRLKSLAAMVKRLQHQLAVLKRLIAVCGAHQRAADKARQRIQAAYNNLLKQYKSTVAAHGKRGAGFQRTINGLKRQIATLNRRCIADVCGVCGGDESSCATRRSRLTCYAVGDPHYRTFDQVAYDFQYAGQFVLAQHGQDFEVQTQNRKASAPWRPALNKGIAVRGGHTVVVAYESWSFAAVLVNGKRTTPPWRRWQRVGPGFIIYRRDNNYMLFRYTHRGQVVHITVQRAGWRFGTHLNIYINAPWQWSSGRSMWGLCGDYDSWGGNDRWWINRWWQRRFRVTSTKRDMFRHPGRRATMFLEEPTTEELQEEADLDKRAGVAPVSELQELTGTQLARPSWRVAKKKPSVKKVSFKAATPKQLADARARCTRSRGTTRKQCMIDVLNGLPGRTARRVFQKANMEGHELELKRCLAINSRAFGLYPAKRCPKPQKNTGYGIAFWFNADELSKERRIIMHKGNNIFVTTVGEDLHVGFGSANCAVKQVIGKNDWTAVTISVTKKGSLFVYVNRVIKCVSKGNGNMPWNEDSLVVGGSSKTDTAAGRVAHLFWVRQTVRPRQARIHGLLNPLGCKRDSTQTLLADVDAESEANGEASKTVADVTEDPSQEDVELDENEYEVTDAPNPRSLTAG